MRSSNPALRLAPRRYPLIVDSDAGRLYWLTPEFQVCSAPFTEHGLLDREHVSEHGVSDPLTPNADKAIDHLNGFQMIQLTQDLGLLGPSEFSAPDRAPIDLTRPIAYQAELNCLYWRDGIELMVAELNDFGTVAMDDGLIGIVDWPRADFTPVAETTIHAIYDALDLAACEDTGPGA